MPRDKPLQLELPHLGGRDTRRHVRNAIVEVVLDGRRLRVRPVHRAGWVRFPKSFREPGARYRVEVLKPAPGGAWIVAGRIRRLELGHRPGASSHS